jgi:hypothetical protein
MLTLTSSQPIPVARGKCYEYWVAYRRDPFGNVIEIHQLKNGTRYSFDRLSLPHWIQDIQAASLKAEYSALNLDCRTLIAGCQRRILYFYFVCRDQDQRDNNAANGYYCHC